MSNCYRSTNAWFWLVDRAKEVNVADVFRSIWIFATGQLETAR